tara:strand:- start:3904 stop:4830 length:927 start_codon:yes stop_codon:yes gene_type:complete
MNLNNLNQLSHLAQVAESQFQKEKRVLTVSVDDVVSKVQIRKQFKYIDELGASILEEGQQTPIIVAPKNAEGKYVIQKGERRWRACKFVHKKEIDIIVNQKELSALDEVAGELIENIQRDDLTSLEIAHALKVFIEDGWSQKEIAKRLGKNKSFVSAHLGLLKLPDCVMHLVHNGVTSDTETLNSLRLLHKVSSQDCEKLCKVAQIQGISRKEVRDALTKTKASQVSAFQPAAVQESEIQKDWKEVKPSQFKILIHVMLGVKIEEAEIVTTRVCSEPDQLWVRTTAHASEPSQLHQVSVSDIELIGVS